MRIPNQPIKIRLLVDKMKLEKVPQKELFRHEIKVALLFFILDFTSKARNFFKQKLNQEVLGSLQKFAKGQNKRFYSYIIAIYNK